MPTKKQIFITSGISFGILVIAALVWIIMCIGKGCAAGTCVYGKCICKTGWSGTLCDHNGGRGKCLHGTDMPNGTCKCDPGYTGAICDHMVVPSKDCSGKCLHGVCTSGGKCKCDPAWKGDKCNQVDPHYS
jgi:hypothetical protein